MSLTLLAGSLAGWLDLVAGWLCLGWLAATKMQKLDVVAICYLVGISMEERCRDEIVAMILGSSLRQEHVKLPDAL